MEVKAILIAGGHGSRLYPFTNYVQKTMLPLYERPVIDYALGTIRRAGIKDITIVSNQFIGQITRHVGQGLEGERIHYVIEEEPRGVAEALKLARPYNDQVRLLIYFSDNITTMELKEIVADFSNAETPPGCILMAKKKNIQKPLALVLSMEMGMWLISLRSPKTLPQILLLVGFIFSTNGFGRIWTGQKPSTVLTHRFLM